MSCGVTSTARGVLAWLALLLSMGWGYWPAATRAADQNASSPETAIEKRLKELEREKRLMRLFADTFEQVKSKYDGSDVSDRELIEAAIRGMMSRLDPHSGYIPPSELAEFRKGIQHEFVGIGIQVFMRDGQLRIASPLFGTPAWRAGLRAGDAIVTIDGTSTKGLSIDEAIKLMGGEVGTEVTIAVLHPGDREAETITLRREHIEQPTVIGYRRSAEGVWNYYCDEERRIAYVRITAFSGNTARDLRGALTKLLEKKMRGLVVDLRFNPGGMLQQAIEVSDMFLREGRIVSIEGRAEEERTWDAQAEGTVVPKDFPVAVLVNRFSASAAEIVAACLQDNGVATIVGERTWGKGSVQNIVVLDEGTSALKLTTAGYHRPSGQNIHRAPGASEADQWGVHPDEGFVVELNHREVENLGVLFSELDELTQREPRTPREKVASEDDVGESSPDQPRLVDRQLEKALEVLRSRIDSATDTSGREQPKQDA